MVLAEIKEEKLSDDSVAYSVALTLENITLYMDCEDFDSAYAIAIAINSGVINAKIGEIK